HRHRGPRLVTRGTYIPFERGIPSDEVVAVLGEDRTARAEHVRRGRAEPEVLGRYLAWERRRIVSGDDQELDAVAIFVHEARAVRAGGGSHVVGYDTHDARAIRHRRELLCEVD